LLVVSAEEARNRDQGISSNSTVVPCGCIASEIHAGPGKAWWDSFGSGWTFSYGCAGDATLKPCGIPTPISTGCRGGYFQHRHLRAARPYRARAEAQRRREGMPLSFPVFFAALRLRGFACGYFPSWFCLTRRTDPLRKGCFAAMNWWSLMHAPGEGTRPSDPWFVLNERVLSSLVAKKGPKTRSTRRPTG
jgi:hypothetical protein